MAAEIEKVVAPGLFLFGGFGMETGKEGVHGRAGDNGGLRGHFEGLFCWKDGGGSGGGLFNG